jgi:hypothetical protein
MNGSNGKMVMADGLGEFLRRERELRQISLDAAVAIWKPSKKSGMTACLARHLCGVLSVPMPSPSA